MPIMPTVTSSERVENYILLIRNQKVILDTDLAELYGVSTKRLNEQVKRNEDRFPKDFMFKLTENEKQKVVAICDHLQNLLCRVFLSFSINLTFCLFALRLCCTHFLNAHLLLCKLPLKNECASS
ncbi:MAG: hypothetical protein A3I12_00960 [Gammaproteobacteria bacterium RIFCSPLOWO2_02_FULL_38_11]|nr:MAG: hypothetical protein A3I12_00960 [Gammaproteobacteria bacterium RIFCSPLOWO2_02_FULL_38_11]OGT77411.1 MAG: hypothetical protein A3G71_01030 [Gammaproteobacteria bacterium RIFCSPLOWO2_12_FULL_38_14]